MSVFGNHAIIGDQECPGCPRSSTPEIFLKDCQTHRCNFERAEMQRRGTVLVGTGKRRTGFLPREISGKNRTAQIRRQITAVYERAGSRVEIVKKFPRASFDRHMRHHKVKSTVK